MKNEPVIKKNRDKQQLNILDKTMTKEEYLKEQADIILNKEITLPMIVEIMRRVATDTSLNRFNELSKKEQKKALSKKVGESDK